MLQEDKDNPEAREEVQAVAQQSRDHLCGGGGEPSSPS